MADEQQALVDDEIDQKLAALDDLEALRAKWGIALVQSWLQSLEAVAQHRGEAS